MKSDTSFNWLFRSCRRPLHQAKLDMGFQPRCNGLLLNRADVEYTHPLVLGVCRSCGLLQIMEPPPTRALCEIERVGKRNKYIVVES
jgi:hypothetical protein